MDSITGGLKGMYIGSIGCCL